MPKLIVRDGDGRCIWNGSLCGDGMEGCCEPDPVARETESQGRSQKKTTSKGGLHDKREAALESLSMGDYS